MMIHRAILNVNRVAVVRRIGASTLQKVQVQGIRFVHKGNESVPAMRWMSIPEKLGLYFFIAFAFLSYPTYVLMSLDNLRPRAGNELGESATAERERRLATRH